METCDPKLQVVHDMCRDLASRYFSEQVDGFEDVWHAFLRVTGCETLCDFDRLDIEISSASGVRHLGAAGSDFGDQIAEIFPPLFGAAAKLYKCDRAEMLTTDGVRELLMDHAKPEQTSERSMMVLQSGGTVLLSEMFGIDSNSEDSDGYVWVEWCNQDRAQQNLVARRSLYKAMVAKDEFQDHAAHYALFVDETAPRMCCNGNDVDLWGDLEPRHRIMLRRVLIGLSHREAMAWNTLVNDLSTTGEEVTAISAKHKQSITRTFNELGDLTHGVIKGKFTAPPGQYMYTFRESASFCWIRPGNQSTCLRRIPKDDGR